MREQVRSIVLRDGFHPEHKKGVEFVLGVKIGDTHLISDKKTGRTIECGIKSRGC